MNRLDLQHEPSGQNYGQRMCEIDYSEGGGRRIISGKARSLRNPELFNVRLSNMVSVELTGIEPRSDSRQFLCNKSSQSYPRRQRTAYLILNGPTLRASLV